MVRIRKVRVDDRKTSFGYRRLKKYRIIGGPPRAATPVKNPLRPPTNKFVTIFGVFLICHPVAFSTANAKTNRDINRRISSGSDMLSTQTPRGIKGSADKNSVNNIFHLVWR